MVRKGENIYKRKDNRWEGRYIKSRNEDGSINYGYLYEHNYSDLKRKLMLKKAFYYENYSIKNVPENVLFLYWSEYWLAKRKKNIKVSTYTSYRFKLDKYILPYFGNKVINSITSVQIDRWKNQLGKFLSIRSVKVIFQLLSSCLAQAVSSKFIEDNPCDNCQPIKQYPLKHKHLSQSMHKKLKKIALEDKKGLAIALAMESGMRIGEIAGLKWQDINFETAVLTISRTIQRIPNYDQMHGKKTIVVEGTPKSKSSYRTIPISAAMLQHLISASDKKIGDYVFGSTKPAEPRKISKWLKNICDLNNIEKIQFHELRHSFASRCLENGVTVTTVSELLGHQSVKMTLDMYTHSYLSEKRKAINLVNS